MGEGKAVGSGVRTEVKRCLTALDRKSNFDINLEREVEVHLNDS
jgi:hypothetical protein